MLEFIINSYLKEIILFIHFFDDEEIEAWGVVDLPKCTWVWGCPALLWASAGLAPLNWNAILPTPPTHLHCSFSAWEVTSSRITAAKIFNPIKTQRALHLLLILIMMHACGFFACWPHILNCEQGLPLM